MLKQNKDGEFEVLNASKGTYFYVDREWLDDIKIDDADKLIYTITKDGILDVETVGGESRVYQNIHGTWTRI